MLEQNLHRFLSAFAKAPKHAEATLYIRDNYYYVHVKNGYSSSLNVKLGYTTETSEIGRKIPKIKVNKDSYCGLSIDDFGYKIITQTNRVTTTTRLESCGDPIEPPAINTTETETVFISPDFFDRAAKVAIAASNDSTKPILKCVSVAYNRRGDYSVAATDGHRLAYISRLPEYDDNRSLILAEDLKMLALLSPGALLLKGNSISIGTEVDYCCHVGGTYPQYGDLIRPGKIGINLGSIKGLIQKLKTLDKKNKVTITVTDDTLDFTSGETVFSHMANNRCTQIGQTIVVNRDYLMDALTNCCGYFYYDNSKSPLIFAGVDINYLMMPIHQVRMTCKPSTN